MVAVVLVFSGISALIMWREKFTHTHLLEDSGSGKTFSN